MTAVRQLKLNITSIATLSLEPRTLTILACTSSVRDGRTNLMVSINVAHQLYQDSDEINSTSSNKIQLT